MCEISLVGARSEEPADPAGEALRSDAEPTGKFQGNFLLFSLQFHMNHRCDDDCDDLYDCADCVNCG